MLQITDAAFVHLAGIHTLDMSRCVQPTTTGTCTDAAIVHLAGIRMLRMKECSQPAITDAALASLHGAAIVNLLACHQFSDTAVDALRASGTMIEKCHWFPFYY